MSTKNPPIILKASDIMRFVDALLDKQRRLSSLDPFSNDYSTCLSSAQRLLSSLEFEIESVCAERDHALEKLNALEHHDAETS